MWMCLKLVEPLQGNVFNQETLKLPGELLTQSEDNGQQILSTGLPLGHKAATFLYCICDPATIRYDQMWVQRWRWNRELGH